MGDISPQYDNKEDLFQLKRPTDAAVCHSDLKRKVQHFKSKLDEISRLYQIKRDNVSQERCYSSMERPTYENKKPSSSHDSVDSGRGTSLSEEDREFNVIDKNARLCVSQASFLKDNYQQDNNNNNSRKNNQALESRIPRFFVESPKKSPYRRSIPNETIISYRGGVNDIKDASNEHLKADRNRCISESEEHDPNLSIDRVVLNRTFSNEERVSSNKIRYLEKRNEELLKRCDMISRENEQLKELSEFLSKGNYEENQERMERITTECEKLKKDKTKVEEELLKSQQMLNDSFRLRAEIEECLWKVQKDQGEKSRELRNATSENEIVKSELEMMKRFCMENDDKIRQYQLLEIQLKECLQKAVAQIGQLELQSKEKKMNDDFTINKLSADYDKLLKENEMTKILYSDALKKIDSLMKEITTLKQQLSLSDTFVDSPSSRRRWFSNALQQDEIFQNTTTTEDEASGYDTSSTFSSRTSQKSRIPRRNSSLTSRHRSSSINKNTNRPYSIGLESDSESIASSSVSTLSRKSNAKDVEIDTSTKPVSVNLKPERRQNNQSNYLNDTDDTKLQRDVRAYSWYVPVEKRKEQNSNSNTNIPKKVTTGIPVKTKPYFNEIVHPAVTTDEVLKAVKSTQNISSAIGSPAKQHDSTNKYQKESPSEEIAILEKRLTDLQIEKKRLEASLSRIPSKGSSKLMNSGTNSRYWSSQEEKCEQRYNDVIKEISSLKLALKKLNIF